MFDYDTTDMWFWIMMIVLITIWIMVKKGIF